MTDIARYKNPAEPKDVVKNWMRSRITIEFLGIWEQLKVVTRQQINFVYANEADLLNVALFGMTAKEELQKHIIKRIFD